ncbi:MAG: tryptophan 2,3-dioxygenase family protein [Flavipsychrobacter sp.]
MTDKKTIELLEQKYIALGENPETYMQGLLHTKPITYWDYISVDTLLSLQKTRTNFKDEEIFILYHQVVELLLKLVLHEIKQISLNDEITPSIMLEKIQRVNRYTTMLISSFDIMKDGMDYDDYNTFRASLTPASGFQSVQFRYIELYCTRVTNLVCKRPFKPMPVNPTLQDCIDNLYWKDAGYDRSTGKKSITLQLFEEKYIEEITRLAENVVGKTVEERFSSFAGDNSELQTQLRQFDRLYNIEWPLVHLNTAQHYLDSRNENKDATGGSEWKKYLHPKYQKRMFFPNLLSEEEKQNWGN